MVRKSVERRKNHRPIPATLKVKNGRNYPNVYIELTFYDTVNNLRMENDHLKSERAPE